MSNWTEWLSEQLEDPETRAEFGAEGVRLRFALALLNARESVGMTQEELAEICGVSQAYISKLESGEANPTIGKIGAIFAAMWMEPTVGFEPLMRESRKSAASDVSSDVSRQGEPTFASPAPGDGD